MTQAQSRREFLRGTSRLGISVAAGTLLVGCNISVSDPQPPRKLPRLGFLAGGGEASSFEPFMERLGELGYVDGRTIQIEYRSATGRFDRFPDLARELVDLEVDVIAATSAQSVQAAKDATGSIPIVMLGSSRDPMEDGFVASVSRPGGNVTGLANAPRETDLKRLELLVEAVPVSRIALLGGIRDLPGIESLGRSLGVTLRGLPLTTGSPDEFAAAFEAAVRQQADAVLTRALAINTVNARLIVELSARHHLPGMYIWKSFVDLGGLMAYEPRRSDLDRRGADYVDMILRGASPADLPVEQPARYDLYINMRTADAMGVTIPESVLAQTTAVIR